MTKIQCHNGNYIAWELNTQKKYIIYVSKEVDGKETLLWIVDCYDHAQFQKEWDRLVELFGGLQEPRYVLVELQEGNIRYTRLVRDNDPNIANMQKVNLSKWGF